MLHHQYSNQLHWNGPLTAFSSLPSAYYLSCFSLTCKSATSGSPSSTIQACVRTSGMKDKIKPGIPGRLYEHQIIPPENLQGKIHQCAILGHDIWALLALQTPGITNHRPYEVPCVTAHISLSHVVHGNNSELSFGSCLCLKQTWRYLLCVGDVATIQPVAQGYCKQRVQRCWFRGLLWGLFRCLCTCSMHTWPAISMPPLTSLHKNTKSSLVWMTDMRGNYSFHRAAISCHNLILQKIVTALTVCLPLSHFATPDDAGTIWVVLEKTGVAIMDGHPVSNFAEPSFWVP